MHCIEFFQKWRKEQNFCSLNPQTAKRIDRYLEISSELKDLYGCSDDDIYLYFPSAALANSGLLGLKKECPLRSDILTRVSQWIKDKKTIRQKDMRKWTDIDHWTEEFINQNCNSLAVNSFKAGRSLKKKSIENVKNASSESLPCTLGSSTEQTLEHRILNIRKISSIGQINTLQILIDKGKAKNLYDAYCLVIAWAAVRINSDELQQQQQQNEHQSKQPEQQDENWSKNIVIGMKVHQIGGSKRLFGVGKIQRINQGAKEALVRFSNGIEWLPFAHITPVVNSSQEIVSDGKIK